MKTKRSVCFFAFAQYAGIYLLLILCFIGLLAFSAWMPHTKNFQKNMKRTAVWFEAFEDDCYYPSFQSMDPFTDSLIIQVGYNFESSMPLRSALLPNFRFYGDNPHKHMVENLRLRIMKTKKLPFIYPYWRYWFGQSAVVKLFHYVGDLRTIYSFISVLMLGLALGCFTLLVRQSGWKAGMIFFMILGLSNYHMIMYSLQFHEVYMIGMIGMIIMLFCNKKLFGPIFFVLGMLCAFLDLLTVPLLSFFIPAFFICGKESIDTEKQNCLAGKSWCRLWILYPLLWGVGYIVSWVTKLFIGVCLSGSVHEVVHQIIYRTGTDLGHISRLDALLKNICYFYLGTPIFLIVLCAILGVVILIHVHRVWKNSERFLYKSAIGYLLWSTAPLIWLMITTNHCYAHTFMTYRNIVVTFAAVVAIILTCFQKNSELEKRNFIDNQWK